MKIFSFYELSTDCSEITRTNCKATSVTRMTTSLQSVSTEKCVVHLASSSSKMERRFIDNVGDDVSSTVVVVHVVTASMFSSSFTSVVVVVPLVFRDGLLGYGSGVQGSHFRFRRCLGLTRRSRSAIFTSRIHFSVDKVFQDQRSTCEKERRGR